MFITKLKQKIISVRNNVKIGDNVIIRKNCIIKNAVIGDNTIIGPNVFIVGSKKNPVIIGKNCYIPYGCFISGSSEFAKIIIGDNVIFAPYCTIFSGSGPYGPRGLQSSLISIYKKEIGDVIIGDNCWIMTKVTILPNTKLGKCVAVAAHSLVYGSFGDYLLIGGIPAKVIKSLSKNIK